MTALLTREQVAEELVAFGRHRWDRVVAAVDEGEPDRIGPYLIVAVGLRESLLQNVEGDGGYGKGWLQIDTRSHAAWLRQHAGCRSGTWTVRAGRSALEQGYVPGMLTATVYAIQLLRGNMEGAHRAGVPERHVRAVGVAAYNCGLGNALRSYREGGLANVDARTAHRDYSRWVLATVPMVKREAEAQGWA